MPLTVGQHLTTEQLAASTAGGDNYIRTKNKQVRGLAYKLKDNPHAPTTPGQSGVIVFGTGRRRRSSAHLFKDSRAAAPTFIKRGVKNWEYIGDYRAIDISEDPATIKKYCRNFNQETDAGVLFIAPLAPSPQEPVIDIVGGGFGTPETRKAVEKAAIDFTTKILEEDGFAVQNHEMENLGYDLSAVKTSTVLLVEVKGTVSPQPRFFLTRNEKLAAEQQPEWRLFVVCNARVSPSLLKYTAEEMCRTFAFKPLAWECILKEVDQ